MQFIVIGKDGADPDAMTRRLAVRDAHLKLGDEMEAAGNRWYGAAILDDDGKMIGSMALVDFSSEQELNQWLEREPYVTGDVWRTVEIYKCNVKNPWKFNRPKEFFEKRAYLRGQPMNLGKGERSNAGGTVDYINNIPGTPPALPFFSQVVWAGDTAYLAGQIALDGNSGNLVSGGIVPETEKIFDNLSLTLSAVGLTLADVAKASVYLTDMDDFSGMNEVYSRRMGTARPARETVVVKSLARDAKVEITLTAFRGKNA